MSTDCEVITPASSRDRRRTAARAGIAAVLTLIASVIAAGPAIAADQGQSVLVSGPTGVFAPLATPLGRSSSTRASITEDGRWVAFISDSDELSGADDDNVTNAYVRDTLTGALILLNSTSAGEPGHGRASTIAIEDDEAAPPRVAIVTAAQLTFDDVDGDDDVFVRDLATGSVELISRPTGGAPSPAGDADDVAINHLGTVVAYSTTAALDPGDTVPDSNDVYTRTLATDATQWESRRESDDMPTTKPGGIPFASEPSLSPDGAVVVFQTDATDIDAGATDTNGNADTFLRFRGSGSTLLVSAPDGSAATAGTGPGSRGQIVRGTGPGYVVLFASDHTNLVAADADNGTDVFRRVVGTSVTEMVSLNNADAPTTAQVFVADADDTGNEILLRNFGLDLFTPDANFGAVDLVLRTRTGPGIGTTRLISRGDGAAGAQASGQSNNGSLSADGNWLGYMTESPELATGARPGRSQVLRRELTGTQLNTPVSFGPGTSALNPGGDGRLAGRRAVSADGRFVLFSSSGAGTSEDDASGDDISELYRRDVLAGETVLVSRDDGSAGVSQGNVTTGAMSADGSRVVYRRGGATYGIFVRDLIAQTTTRVSRLPNGMPDPAAGFDEPDISADGRRVAWVSGSDLTGTGEAAGDDVFVRDVASDAVTLASRGDGEGPDANGSSLGPSLDGSGDRVAFISSATNLGDGDTDGLNDVHVRNIASGRTVLVSRSTGGQKANFGSFSPSISADGARVVFASPATNLDPAAPGPGSAVFLHDTTASVTSLVNRDGAGGAQLAGSGLDPVIAADGATIAWIQEPYTPPGGTAGPGQALVRTPNGPAEVASRATGAAGVLLDASANNVAIDSDGSCVAFDTRARNVIAAPIPAGVLTTWLRARGARCPDLPPAATPVPGPGTTTDRTRPQISNLRLTRSTFRVGPKRTAVSAQRRRTTPAGTTVQFRLSETARVTLTIERRSAGRRVGKSCRKPTRALRRRKACVRYVRHAAITRRSVTAGIARIAFSGRIGNKALPAGSYRIAVGARDAAGNAAATRRAAFRIVRR